MLAARHIVASAEVTQNEEGDRCRGVGLLVMSSLTSTDPPLRQPQVVGGAETRRTVGGATDFMSPH